jgi:predicted DCC family thiol-disulfide oxidoreductase YuxK
MIIPRFIRDAVYRFIAVNRYKWFGKTDQCRVPTAEERERFLE